MYSETETIAKSQSHVQFDHFLQTYVYLVHCYYYHRYNIYLSMATCVILQKDNTALHKASREGNLQIVECLVNAKANISIANKVRIKLRNM